MIKVASRNASILLVLAMAGRVAAAPAGPVNIAPQAKATASSSRPECPAAQVNDGDRKTSWSVKLEAKAGEWLRLDWPAAQTVAGVVLYPTGPYLASFDIETATEAGWERAARLDSADLPRMRRIAVALAPRRTKSLRLANLAPTAAGGPAFFEIEVYGDRGIVDRMNAEVDIAASGDSRGNLIGTVSKDMGGTGIVGAPVTVRRGSWTRTVASAENGFFAVPVPLEVRGPMTIAALGHSRVVDASDIPLRLTARPSTRRLPLEGTWRILVDPPPTGPADSAGWRDIEVPSHWEMKGFRAKGDTAVMRKVFDVPAEWRGKIIKLRADGIYSHCQARLNGVRIGSHDGGATPVELDLTGAARPGRPNTLDLFIRARSPAAEFDHMSVYAYFELAGIWRPIEVFAVDLVHIARLNWAVAFDKSFADADLTVNVTLANAGHGPFQGGPLTVRLLDPSGKPAGEAGAFVSLPAGEEKAAPLRIHVAGPEPWTAERPRLYRLEASFNGEIVESPVGFRQMDVSGKRFTINGRGAKLFGVCLHSADPAAGRAVSAALVEKDLSLIKGCNLNAVRTSHYPPHPHAPEYADRIGLYIEDEGPACWADTDDLRDAPLYMGIYASFVERDRNHPSVVYWSMCNESNYTRVFQMTQKYIKSADPTRPSSGSYAPDIDPADMIVRHHPTNLNLFIRDMGKMPKPVFMDECLSIFHGWGDLAYSLEIDPGMHDYWITKVDDVVRACFETENQVGTMIWAWVDDAFQIPGRGIGYWRRDLPPIRYEDAVYGGLGHGYVGDCVWGLVDGWRRPRPEWELCRQVYSPVQIASDPLTPGPVRVPVFNQNVFENLRLYECRWTLAERGGIARADVGPRSKGVLEIPAEAKAGDILDLRFFDGERPVVSVRLPFQKRLPEPWALGRPAGLVEEPKDRYLSGASVVSLRSGRAELAYERVGGGLMWGLAGNNQVLLKGPRLHVLKSEAPTGVDPSGWQFTGETHGDGFIRWNGRFGGEWTGGYEIRMDEAGQAEFAYDFRYGGPDLWVRELGLQFDLPLAFQTLEWDRRAEFTDYSDEHIGRPHGTALAHPGAASTVPPGARPMSLDDHPWGSNDFRSAKRDIYWARLSGAWGAVKIVSDGTQTVRCALTPHEVTLKVLDFYGGSGAPQEWSVQGFHYGAGRLIKTGERVRGTVRLKLEEKP